jgi:hypothetical protein
VPAKSNFDEARFLVVAPMIADPRQVWLVIKTHNPCHKFLLQNSGDKTVMELSDSFSSTHDPGILKCEEPSRNFERDLIHSGITAGSATNNTSASNARSNYQILSYEKQIVD